MPEDADNSPVAGVRASFSLPIGGAFLHASAVVPRGRTRLTELLPILQNLDNAIVDRISQEAEAAGSPISCGPGCGACCRQLVPLSFFEAEALTEWLRSLPDDRRAALEGRFHRALLALRDAGVIDKILSNNWVGETLLSTELAMDYFRAGVPCPFLENESCGIHPIRPLICREYLVTSPPASCKDPAGNEVAGVRLPLRLSSALYAFGRQIEEDQRGWIPLVFLLAWGRSGATPGNYVSGTGEEVLRKFLEQVMQCPPDAEGPEKTVGAG